jgi:hypothetical protein
MRTSRRDLLALYFLFSLFSVESFGQVNSTGAVQTFAGSYDVGAGTPVYTTLKSFFDALNVGTLTDNVTANLVGDCNETATAELNQIPEDPAGSNFTITIQPNGGSRLITGNITGPLIDFNGAERATINGYLGGTKSITIRNTSSSGPAIRFINEATGNTIANCIIEGGDPNPAGGTILFSTTTGTSGNDDNTIQDNDLRDRTDIVSVPANAIYSSGTSGATQSNSDNTITGNNIFNWTGSGVLVDATGNGNAWTITNNKLYQTAGRSTALISIALLSGASNNLIYGNSIGGSSIYRLGNPLTTTNTFTGILVAVGSDTATTVQGNTLANLDISGGSSQTFKGISVTSGRVNMSSNAFGGGYAGPKDTIRTSHDADMISLTGSGVMTVESNAIRYVSYYDGGSSRLAGIYVTGGTVSVGFNTIRDVRSNSSGTEVTNSVVGIYSTTPLASCNFEGNRIYDIAQTNTGTSAYQITGMFFDNAGGTTQIHRNLVYGITAAGTGTGASAPKTSGIHVAGGGATYSNNMIAIGTGIANENRVYGIEDAGTGVSRFYNNSVNVTGSTGAGDNATYGFLRSGTGADTLRNNIFVNTRTGGTRPHFALGNASSTGWGAGTSNYNVFYTGTDSLTQWTTAPYNLAGWQAASLGDGSTAGKDPGFVSPTDLHINPAFGIASNNAFPLAPVEMDFDGQLRSLTTPDRGADEYTGIPPSAFALLTPAPGATSVPVNGTLVWQKSTGAEYYDVYFGTVNPPATIVSANQSDTSYSYSVTGNTTYYWSVRAKSGNGETDPGVTPFSFATAPNPPAAPANLLLSNVRPDSINLSWLDNANNEDGYRVYRSQNPGGPFTNVSGDLPPLSGTGLTDTYPDTGLSPNTIYYYRVLAFSTLQGDGTPAADDTTTLARIPGAPVLTNPGYYSIQVTIDPNGNPATTQFAVRVNGTQWLNTSGALVGAPAPATYAAFGGASGVTASGLSVNTSYTFDVLALNDNGLATAYGPPATVSTLAPVNAFPFFEGFEDVTFPPAGWSMPTTKVWARTTASGAPNSGTGAAKVSSSPAGTAILQTPPFALPANYQARFWWKDNNISLAAGGAGSPMVAAHDTTFFEITTDGGTTWNTLTYLSSPTAMSGYLQAITDLSAYAGTVSFRWRDLSDGTVDAYGAGLDDIELLAIPLEPAGIVSPANGGTGVSVAATLNWSAPTGGGPVSGYKLYFGTNNPPTDSINGTNLGNVLTYDPPFLQYSTTYYWKIVPYNTLGGDATGCPVWSFSTVVPVPVFVVVPTNLPFGPVNIGDSLSLSTKIYNTGTANLNITNIASDNAVFVPVTTGGTVLPGDSLQVVVEFKPVAVGAASGNLVFTHNAAGNPDTVTLSGVGVGLPVFLAVPTTLPFGPVNIGDSLSLSTWVHNTGTANLNVTAIASDNGVFVPVTTTGTVIPGDSLEVVVEFKPVAAVAATGSLVFTHNATSSPDTVTLSGTGVPVGPSPKFVTVTPDTIIAKNPAKGTFWKPVKRDKGLQPNWANLLDETVAQGGFRPASSESDSAGGMVVGVSFMENVAGKWKVKKDSGAVHAWVRLTKWDFKKPIGKGYNALQKSLEDKTGIHDKQPRGLDSTLAPGDIKRKLLKKQLTSLTPKKSDNALFAELVALKVNIAASALGKTPGGLGDLIFDRNSSSFDEQTVKQIAATADTMMTRWQSYDSSDYADLYETVQDINGAFVAPFDTASFNVGGLVLKGVTELADVPFLKTPNPFVVTRLEPTTTEYESGEENDFEDEEFEEGLVPVAAKLYQNYPNPFNPGTTIGFRLLEPSQVTIRIYNTLGQEMATLMTGEELEEGYNEIRFDASQLSSGVYFYRIDAQGLGDEGLRSVVTNKMLLLK